MFYRSKLDSIERDMRSLERDVRSIDGRICHIEGMARLALWVVPTLVALITALGTAGTVFFAHH